MAEATSSSAAAPTTPSTFLKASSSSIIVNSQKRRITNISDYDFFAPASSSFQPRPYAPNSDGRMKPFQYTRSHGRSHDSLTVPAGMDPHPSDPNVIFIHPPFTIFPDSSSYPEGLNFQVMVDNPEWFLDAKDFVHENNTNPHAVPYPPALEPPRGWCPAKKKDLKERGAEGWPEGEEPRLRCTFCRRNYAGVNAKSMWRRHVFEKHKIAMANRRDGADRPRGRSSNKENKQTAPRKCEDGHDTLVNLKVEVHPGTESRNTSHKSKFRSIGKESSTDRRECKQIKDASTNITGLPPESITSTSTCQTSSAHTITPPLTPHASSDVGNTSTESSGEGPPTPLSSVPLVPQSPYDPLLTPSFRHSPPRLPSDQPWRYPSPSHPLHSETRELSLSMLVRNASSPLVKGSPVLGGSPLIYPPSLPSSSRFARPETPLSGFRLPLSSSNHVRFTKGRLGGSPLAPKTDGARSRYRIEESPLSRGLSRQPKRLFSELTDDWFSEASTLSNQMSDPFNSLFSSGDVERNSPIKRVLEAESPILRNRNSMGTRGLGIGLLEPFNLSGSKPSDDDEIDISDALEFSSQCDSSYEPDEDMTSSKTEQESRRSPSLPRTKKRRLSIKG